jgi:hypothetical protein
MASGSSSGMSVSQAIAAKSITPIVVQDSLANVQANLSGLQKLAASGKLGSFSISESTAKVQFTAAQLNTSAALVSKLNASGVAMSVKDTAANLARIASRLTPDMEVFVQDSSAHVLTSLSALQSLAAANKLDAVSFTDSNPTLILNASQFAGTSALRALMTANIQVVDTAANLASSSVIGAASVTVKDTASALLRNFDVMRVKAANGGLSSVVLTDKKPALTLTAAQYLGSEALRAKLQGVGYTIQDTATAVASNAQALAGLNVSVIDTVANVQSNLDALQGFAQGGKLSALKFTNANNPTLTMTAAQALKLGNIAAASITLKDTAANIQSNFDGLSLSKKITSVQLTDTARPVLQLTEAQYKKGATFMAKVTGVAVSVQFSGNYGDYKVKANTDGSYSVGSNKYKGVNIFSFRDTATFVDTGDANINAVLMGGTPYWWRDASKPMGTSDVQVKSGVYALAEGASRQTLTYSFLNQQNVAGTADDVHFQSMTVPQKKAVRDAFDYLSSIINVKFEESNVPGQADINFGTNDQSAKSSSGYANVPNGSGDHGTYLMLDNSRGNLNGNMDQGSYGWETLIHEIGHTLGLKHPGDYNASGGGSPGPFLSKALDSRQYTVMSYNNPAGSMLVNATSIGGGVTSYKGTTVNPSTYMMFDMAALQFMYGAGDGKVADKYQVTSFTANWAGMETLWAPKNGVIDASAVRNSNIIDLRAGAFSSINVIPQSITNNFPTSLKNSATYMGLNNVGLAYGSEVILARGGSGDDIFYTSAASDVTIDGGAGANDTVYLAGSASDWVRSNNSYVNSKLSRTVTISNVEVIKYYSPETYAMTHARLDMQA